MTTEPAAELPPELTTEVTEGVFRGAHSEKWREIAPDSAPFIREAFKKAARLRQHKTDIRQAYLEGVTDAIIYEQRLAEARELITHFDPDQESQSE